ncbi:MAG: response regulator transcription factor [Flavobacteriales bacterium]|nr:response regulator transcription factor [Flavobacteriales bacterium]MCB9365288.1 response regulator transcription factor [Flavobacteriales bacterium]
MKKINLLIVDDRDVIRDAFKVLLSKYPSIRIVSEAENGADAVDIISRKGEEIDIVLMDINLPKMNGMEATKKIKAINSNVKIIAFSLHTSAGYIVEMIKAGVSGYVTKSEEASTFLDAIQTVYNGGIYLSDKIDSTEYDKATSILRRRAC